ncbi:MAG: hypothetical protein A2Z25_24035 [Planctomycetes bacterium RBG_16_55_9]|nr:MAG: hypothetical protein A2Z25_24035 [Planctomycetes bacterium RBG_16_55_9]
MNFEQQYRRLNASSLALPRYRNNIGLAEETGADRCSTADLVFTGLLVLIGAAMQGFAHKTTDAAIPAIFFLFAGYALVTFVFSGKPDEQRVFLLSYAICIFAGGLAQLYSLVAFGDPQSTSDATSFLQIIPNSRPYYTWWEINHLSVDGYPLSRGAPLAIAIWQGVYRICSSLGLDYGAYIGVIVNALVIGLLGCITVRTAREVFGDDSWRLRRVGILFAFCGLFILFGAVLLRDCFTTFFNALVLWGLVRWLCRPTPSNLFIALVLTGVSALAMMYLRLSSIVLFGFFWFLAFTCWFLEKRFNATRLIIIFLGLCILVLASQHLMSYIRISRDLQTQSLEHYADILMDTSESDSLGMALLVRQPLPVRLVLGTAARMIFPLPLWAYFHSEAADYHLIKGYHGIYQVFIMPLVLAGMFLILKIFRKDRKAAIPLIFLAIYLIMSVEAVIATSLEQRHIAQFMPALLILAAVPDTTDVQTRMLVRRIAIGWFAVVVLAHVAWIMIKVVA